MGAKKADVLRRTNIGHIVRAVSGITGERTFVPIGAGVLDIAAIRNRMADLAGADMPAPDELTRRIDVVAAGPT